MIARSLQTCVKEFGGIRPFDDLQKVNQLLAVKESWCRKVRGKGRRGISFAWRQHRFFFVDFLLFALSYEKLEDTTKERE